MDHKTLQFKAEQVSQDEMKFAGFASTPDLDEGGDIIVKGAWGRTLAMRGSKVKMLWGHKSDMMPLGKFSLLEEREGGLYVEGKVSDTTAGRDVMTLLRDGAIDSMSIGFIAKEKEYNDDGVRVIKDLDLFEVSLVNFPMNEKAIITQVKNQFNPRELERILCEAGYSNSQAKRIASVGIKSLREADEEETKGINEKDLKALSDAIKSFNKSLTGQE